MAAFADAYREYAREHPGRYAVARLRLGPETAAASAGGRHARMARAILRGYDLDEPDATHAVRMLGSVVHGYVSLELAGGFEHSVPPRRNPGIGSWIRSTRCYATTALADPRTAAPPQAVRCVARR
ncbi:TetR-like C-terminal domain-containing protein [Micromonospora sp. WMMD961]|nr:TetR-like C-terminal domain-containing protein [Micromonospora sp. WMMD961]MDG4782442.1 TetR-like C-terminal domain-containing protein [Micromonospora sp. WMMD961]